MKKFQTPEIELLKLEELDVITTSDPGDEEAPPSPSVEEFCV